MYGYNHLLMHGMALGVIGKLLWGLQLLLIIHVFRTGRPYWWFWVLSSAPVLGGLAYIVVELLPEMRSRGRGHSWKPRSWIIKGLQARLEDCDTVETRLELAELLLDANRAREAYEVAEECLNGIFRDDPNALAAVARYRVEAEKYPEALDALSKIKPQSDRVLNLEIALLKGRALVMVGNLKEGQAALCSIQHEYVGEEVRYFLGVAWATAGNLQEARAIWEDIRKRFRKGNPAWRRSEKCWFKLAGVQLKAER